MDLGLFRAGSVGALVAGSAVQAELRDRCSYGDREGGDAKAAAGEAEGEQERAGACEPAGSGSASAAQLREGLRDLIRVGRRAGLQVVDHRVATLVEPLHQDLGQPIAVCGVPGGRQRRGPPEHARDDHRGCACADRDPGGGGAHLFEAERREPSDEQGARCGPPHRPDVLENWQVEQQLQPGREQAEAEPQREGSPREPCAVTAPADRAH